MVGNTANFALHERLVVEVMGFQPDGLPLLKVVGRHGVTSDPVAVESVVGSESDDAGAKVSRHLLGSQPYLSRQEAADYLGVSLSHLKELIRSQQIEVVKTGVGRRGRVFLRPSALDAYMAKHVVSSCGKVTDELDRFRQETVRRGRKRVCRV